MRKVAAAAALVALSVLVGCGDDDEPLSKELAGYTDTGDGCAQVVTAISYADDVLRSLGQEQHQKFDDAVRSRLGSVNGTVALEVKDFPSKDELKQARTVGRLADRAAAPDVEDADRVQALREYRHEAAQLVIDCAAYLDEPN